MISLNNIPSILLYSGALFLFFMGNSFISIWIFMEMNLLLFLFTIYLLEENKTSMIFKLSMFYFLIQSLGSIFFLLSILFNDWNFTVFNQELLLLLAMSLKIGLFPFSFWVFHIIPFINSFSFFLILTLQKIPYFIILFTTCSEPEILCFLSFMMGSQLVYFSRSLDSLLVASSVSSVIWVFLLFSESEYSFFFFFFAYSLCLSPLLLCKSIWRGLNLGSFYFFFSISVLFMFTLGLPPFSLFMFKLDVLSFVMLKYKELVLVFIFFFNFLTLSGYFKTFFKDLLFVKYLYNFNYKGVSLIFSAPLQLIPFFFLFI